MTSTEHATFDQPTYLQPYAGTYDPYAAHGAYGAQSDQRRPQPGDGRHAVAAQPQDQQPAYAQAAYEQPVYEQPAYAQPVYEQSYGQPGYDPHAYDSGYQYAYQPVAKSKVFGLSALIGAAGAGALGVAFTVLPWYHGSSGFGGKSSHSTFGNVHDALGKFQRMLDGSPFGRFFDLGTSPAYFGWLGWALLALAVLTAAIAVSPVANAIARGAAAAVGVAGLAVTAWNLQLFTFDTAVSGVGTGKALGGTPTSWFDWVKHTSFGAWAALAGFALLTIAAAIGPRRRAAR